MKATNLPTPKQFLKNRRPEQFSTSEETTIGQLDRVHLENYLVSLNTKSKELQFETFAKELCQKIICPNLLEQTGPVAGGDGKTDTQTFPVSEQNKLLWYVGVNDNANNERWAFAVSTQKSWKSKCKTDVKKIIETERGYTKVFCITNQLIKANQRSALEDELSKQYNIQVCILDLSWILDKIYKNKLENIAIETLQMPTNFKREVKLSADDYSKKQRFDELEYQINSKIKPDNISHNQVGIFLEVANLSKQLEQPVFQTQGYYARAINIAKRFGTTNQLFNAYYSYARASYYWFEDLDLFKNNFISIYELITESSNSILWDDFVTLLTIYMTEMYIKTNKEGIQDDSIIVHTINQLKDISKDKSRPSNSLQAELSLAKIELMMFFQNHEKIDEIFCRILNVCANGEYLVGFPFESVYGYINELDDLFSEYTGYQALQEYLTEQSIKRHGDTKASRLTLERGLRQAEKKSYYKAIQLIGKTLAPLNKEESIADVTFANIALATIYTQVDLHWAARGSLLIVSSLLTNYFHKHGVILSKAVEAYFSLAWNELVLGRIAQSLTWYEAALLSSQAISSEFIDEDKIENFDGCLAHLLLNCDLKNIQELEYLVESLEAFGLLYSKIALLYVLGYEDEVKKLLDCDDEKRILQLMVDFRDYDTGHPSSKLLLSTPKYISYSSKVLGCEVKVSFPNKTPFIELAEAIYTSLESFLATALIDSIYAKIPIIHIDITSFDDTENLLTYEFSVQDRGSVFEIFCHPYTWASLNPTNKPVINKQFEFFIISLIDKAFIIKDIETSLKKMITEDLVFARSMMFETCLGAIYNVLGENTNQNLLDKLTQGERYPLMRKTVWDSTIPKKTIEKVEEVKIGDHNDMPYFEMEKHKHSELAITSIIRVDLWDAAVWRGVGYEFTPNKSPYMFLLFRYREQGLRIFRDLIEQLTSADRNNRLRISIIRGINKYHPAHYRVVISENIKSGGKAKLFTIISRIQTMEPSNDLNWQAFENLYNKFQSFKIAPAYIAKGKNEPDVAFDLAINLEQLIVKQAWEIGINDLEKVAIYPDDNIIVPVGVETPPYIKALESMERGN